MKARTKAVFDAKGGRDYAWETTVADERANKIHIHDRVGEEESIEFSTERNSVLEMPRLLLPSDQVNMRAGRLPPPEANGISYLKIPVNAL